MDIAGVSAGGVLIPSVAMPQTTDSVIVADAAKPFRPEEGGGWMRPYQSATALEEELEAHYNAHGGELLFPVTGEPALRLIQEAVEILPPLSWVSWCKTDVLKTILGMRPDCDFVIPLVAEIAEIAAVSYRGNQSSDPGERPVAWLEPAPPGSMEIVIGWSPTKPELGKGHQSLFGFESPSGEPGGEVYVQGNPFGGGPTYELPIDSWVNSPYALDCLQVGRGNYNPTAKSSYDSTASGISGSAIEPFSPTIKKYEEEHGRAARRAFEHELIDEGLIQRAKNQVLLLEFREEVAALWEGYESAYNAHLLTITGETRKLLEEDEVEIAELEKAFIEFLEAGDLIEPLKAREEYFAEHKAEIEAKEAEIKKVKARIEGIHKIQNQTLEAEEKAYDKYATFKYKEEPLPSTGILGDFYRIGYTKLEEEWREKYGPYRLGVKKWAYRFKWHRPPGGLPNLNNVGGYFVIEIRGKPGTRWVDWEGFNHMGFEVQQGPPILGAGPIRPGVGLVGAVPS